MEDQTMYVVVQQSAGIGVVNLGRLNRRQPILPTRVKNLIGAHRVAARRARQLVRQDWEYGIPSIDGREATQFVKAAKRLQPGDEAPMPGSVNMITIRLVNEPELKAFRREYQEGYDVKLGGITVGKVIKSYGRSDRPMFEATYINPATWEQVPAGNPNGKLELLVRDPAKGPNALWPTRKAAVAAILSKV